MTNTVSKASSTASSVPPVKPKEESGIDEKRKEPTRAASFADSAKETIKDSVASKKSAFSTSDKLIVGVGVGLTVAAMAGVVVFWTTAGVGVSAAIVNIVIDLSAVGIMGSVGTGIAWGLKELVVGVFDLDKAKAVEAA
jgi:hypothetical protein